MIEIQCTSCYTRYRIDERVLPDDTPTFKCSRCDHVFSVEPRSGASDTARASERRTISRSGTERQPPPSAPTPPQPAADEPARAQPARPEPAPPEPVAAADKDDPLERPFAPARDEAPSASGSLAFDFHAEDNEPTEISAGAQRSEEPREDDRWKVGGEPAADFGDVVDPFRGSPGAMSAPEAVGFDRSSPVIRDEAPARPVAREITDDYSAIRGRTHSASFFIALFFLIAVAFAGLSFAISSAPAASAALLDKLPAIDGRFAPPVRAAPVALSNVHASYQTVGGSASALVISGAAENRSAAPLHTLRIDASLLDAAHHGVAATSVALGNTLSRAMIAQMTPREINFYQKLDAPTQFDLAPGRTTPFCVVFTAPPASAASFKLEAGAASGTADGGQLPRPTP